jgi:predicted ATPase
VDARMRALWSLWNVHLATGDARAADSVARRFADVSGRTGETADLLMADRLVGQPLLLGGKLREAQDRFERVLTRYVAPTSQRHRSMYLNDQRVMSRAQLAPVLLLRGFADQAAAQARLSLEEATAANNKLSLCWALRLAVFPVAVMTGDLDGAERAQGMLGDLTSNMSAVFWDDAMRWLQGKLLVARGDFTTGLTLLRDALAAYDNSGWIVGHAECMAWVADALIGSGLFTEARASIAAALTTTERRGENWFDAELHRLDGTVRLQQTAGGAAAAEHCFRRALEVARTQDALFWELRAAMGLARLWICQDRPAEARDLLAPVYQRFAEGFGTADLTAARAMLATLPR